MMDDAAFKKMMIGDEDLRLKPYYDKKGKISIAIGRNLTDNGLRPIEVDFLFSNDLADTKKELNLAIPWWVGLSNNRQMVLANMAMNNGMPHLLGFKKMLAAAKAGRYKEAAAEILDSEAARDAPDRYHRLASMMAVG